MADRRVPVNLVLTDNFTGPLSLIKQAAHDMHVRWERDAATWEPHDWSEWS